MTINVLELSKRDNFCVLPFIAIQAAKGSISPCCKLTMPPKNRLDPKETVEEYLKSEELVGIQESFLRGEVPRQCSKCFIGLSNNAMYPKEKAKEFEAAVDLWDADPEIDGLHSTRMLNVVVTNSCNLGCRMCGPYSSSTLYKGWDEKIMQLTKVQIFDTRPQSADMTDFMEFTLTDPRFKGIKAVVLSGGEPLIHPSTIDWLQRFVQNGVRKIWVTTSLSVDKFGFIEQFENLPEEVVRGLTISLDGDREMHEYIRVGIKMDEFLSNMEKLRHTTRTIKTLTISPSAMTFHKAIEMLEFGYELLGNDCYFRLSFVEDNHLRFDVLPPALRKRIFDEFNRKASLLDVSKFKRPDNVQTHIDTIRVYMQRQLIAPFQPSRFSTFIEYVEYLDKRNGTNIYQVFPDLAEYHNLN